MSQPTGFPTPPQSFPPSPPPPSRPMFNPGPKSGGGATRMKIGAVIAAVAVGLAGGA